MVIKRYNDSPRVWLSYIFPQLINMSKDCRAVSERLSIPINKTNAPSIYNSQRLNIQIQKTVSFVTPGNYFSADNEITHKKIEIHEDKMFCFPDLIMVLSASFQISLGLIKCRINSK